MSENDWRLTFRISGSLLVLSLIGLVLPLNREISLICWVIGGVSLPVCLLAAKKLKDVEKVDALADATWLKDDHFSEGTPDAADD